MYTDPVCLFSKKIYFCGCESINYETAEMMDELINRKEISVRFSEVDSLQIVWHGHYVQYFEDGREAFGKEFGLGYLDVYENGLLIPVVRLECDYKFPVKYGDTIVVETKYVDCKEAKIQFEYSIFRKSDNKLVATGKSVQVFLDRNYELFLTLPPFYESWKRKMSLLTL
jgi:acyl-CoA thioester hydrolase